MAADERLIIRFDDLGVGDVALVGGKNSSLGELRVGLGGSGVRVPDGFAVTAEAYRRLVAANDLAPVIEQGINELRADPTALPRVGAMIRSHFLAATIPDEVRDALAVAYAGLVSEAGVPITVAVRSSATAEDLPEASFAGQHESYLNVTGDAAVLQAYVGLRVVAVHRPGHRLPGGERLRPPPCGAVGRRAAHGSLRRGRRRGDVHPGHRVRLRRRGAHRRRVGVG